MFDPPAKARETYRQSPEIARGEVLFRWAYDHYDGLPVSGLAIYQGRKYWFDAAKDMVERGRYYQRDYLLLELSAQELAEVD